MWKALGILIGHFLIVWSAAIPAASAGDWPQFRGPNGAGLADEETAPIEWGPEQRIGWKVKVPGYGWSSPVVWGDNVFLTTASSDEQPPPERKGPGGGNPTPLDAVFRWEVHCLDATTGKSLWQRVAAERQPTIGNHISNTYASETPVTDGERVYAYFGMAGVVCCYDVVGELLWKHELGPQRRFGSWGTSSSPTQDDSRLFIQCDNEEHSCVVAFDKRTGNELWRASRPEKSTWGSPVLWRNQVRSELVLMGARRIRSYDPATGNVFWELATAEGVGGSHGGPSGKGGSGGGKPAAGGCKSTPVATPQMIYVGMAPKIQGQSLGPMWAVKAGAAGDISLRQGETSNTHIAWFRADAGPHFASAIVYRDLLYIFTPHGGELRCFDARTGADVYRQRLPRAGDFKSSPWAQHGNVLGLDENGATFVVQAGPDFKLLSKNELGELCWSTPALADGAIFLRGVEHLYCIRERGPQGD